MSVQQPINGGTTREIQRPKTSNSIEKARGKSGEQAAGVWPRGDTKMDGGLEENNLYHGHAIDT